MAFLPAFGERAVPVRIKIALTLELVTLVFPSLVASPFVPIQSPGEWVQRGGAEVLSGVFLGFSFRLLVFALQVAGTIAAQSTSLAQVFGGGVTPDPQPALGNIFVMSGLALAALSGFHVKLTEAFLLSFALLPLGTFPSSETISAWAIADVSRMFVVGFSLSAPFVAAAMVYNLALGVINRAMPQLMVAFVGAPALTAGGLALSALSVPFLLAHWWELFEISIFEPFGVVR
jgi:flagellar biosynthetic protein FliR